MSSHTYATPLRLAVEPSRRLGALLVLAHAGAALCPFLVLPVFPAVVLLLGVGVSLHHTWRMHLGARRITRVTWRAGDEWVLETADGETHHAHLAPQPFVSAQAVVLRLRTEQGSRALVLLPDGLDTDSLRRLRVRLRLEAATIAQPGPVVDRPDARG